MTKTRSKKNSQTRVDRFLDRVKNNRLAAIIIVGCLAIGALASLTDSVKKLTDLLAPLNKIDVSGQWKSDVAAFYPVGPEIMRLQLCEVTSEQIVGSIQFSSPESAWPSRQFGIIEGRRDGNKLTLTFDSGATRYKAAEGQWVASRETIVGELAGDELRLVYRRDGHGGVPITARRVQR